MGRDRQGMHRSQGGAVACIAWIGVFWTVAVVTTGAAAEEQTLLRLDAEGGDEVALGDNVVLLGVRGSPVIKAARQATKHAQAGKKALEAMKKSHPAVVAAKKAAAKVKKGASKLKKMEAKAAGASKHPV